METTKTTDFSFTNLKGFVDKATKLGKYPSNTANGYLAAIKMVEAGLLQDEPKTMDYIIGHVEELIVRRSDDTLSPQSIPVYVGRFKTVCKDYASYGQDGTSIYRWNRTIRKKREKTPELKEEKINGNGTEHREEAKQEVFAAVTTTADGTKLNLVSWRLRPGVVVRIELPEDLNEQDVKKLKALLDIELGVGL
jgi:hypothetical protein